MQKFVKLYKMLQSKTNNQEQRKKPQTRSSATKWIVYLVSFIKRLVTVCIDDALYFIHGVALNEWMGDCYLTWAIFQLSLWDDDDVFFVLDPR